MDLKQFLNNNRLTQHQFINKVAEETGHTIPQGTLAKWILGTRIPRKSDMLKIYKTTQGMVQPNDFYIGELDE